MKGEILRVVFLLLFIAQGLNAQTIGFLTKDNHQIIGSCKKGDTDPARCSLIIEFQWELQDSSNPNVIKKGAVCRDIKGVYPYDEKSLIPFGPLFKPRLVIVDPGELSDAIAEYNVVSNKWQLYHRVEKKWVDAAAFGSEIVMNLKNRVIDCQIRN